MDKYTYDDVLTEKDVRTGKVDRRIIGKLGWFADDMSGCLCEAEEEAPRRLLNIVGASNVPFVDEWHSSYQYFLLSKQHRMEEKKDDAKWLFGCDADGEIGIVLYYDEDRQTYFMRFNKLILRSVPEKDFRKIRGHLEPFDISDISVRHTLRGEYIVCEEVDENGDTHLKDYCINGFDFALDGLNRTRSGHILAGGMRITPLELLDKWNFLGGTPCGVVVEDKEERP